MSDGTGRQRVRGLGDRLQPPPVAVDVQQALVVSVAGTTATVRIGGSATAVTGVHWLGVAPAAGATVWLIVKNRQRLILGTQS